VPADVTVTIKDREVTVKGPRGELAQVLADNITARLEDKQLLVERQNDEKETTALHGTMRSLIANNIEGVSKGFHKALEIQGVGFRAQMQGQQLVLALGYSHPIEYQVPDGVEIKLPDASTIEVSGNSKQLVGQVSARIRGFCPAEPYKGKGVRYKGEYIRRKAGKTVA
jgi:large subunit ribosomal protein L6